MRISFSGGSCLFPFRSGVFVPLCLVLASAFGRSAETDLNEAWGKLDKFQFNDAFMAFAEKRSNDESRERKFGEAVSLLNYQPRSDSNVLKSLELLNEVYGEKPNDDLGALSLYYMGRIHQLHLDNPDRDKALEYFRKTLALHSGNPLAEMAATAILFIEIYDAKNGAKTGEKLASLEPMLSEIRSDIARREFHTALGFAYLEFAEDGNQEMVRKALSHLLEADRIGATRWQAESALWVAIGEASRHLGDRNTALTYYRKFVDTYKRDRRVVLIRERMAQLQDGASP